MVLQILKNINIINGSKVLVMDKLREERPEMFDESGSMDYKEFEKLRADFPIQIRLDKNSISFTIQNGPMFGVNGCQVTALIEAALLIIETLNSAFPCRENALTITKLQEALMWQEARTKDREKRQVEGYNKP